MKTSPVTKLCHALDSVCATPRERWRALALYVVSGQPAAMAYVQTIARCQARARRLARKPFGYTLDAKELPF